MVQFRQVLEWKKNRKKKNFHFYKIFKNMGARLHLDQEFPDQEHIIYTL